MLSRLFKKALPQDQRGHYRRSLGKGAALGVKMICGNGAPVSGELVDLSAGGAAIEFGTPLPAGELDLGSARELVFSSLTKRSIRTIAHVRSMPRGEGPERYGFQFLDAHAIFDQLDDSFYRYFNRRRYRRAQPGLGENVQVDIAFGSIADKVKVYDLSIGGISFYADETLVEHMHPDLPIDVRLQVPKTDQVLTFYGLVRHVSPDARGVRVGLALEAVHDGDSKRHARKAEAALAAYIQRRLDEIDRYNSAYN